VIQLAFAAAFAAAVEENILRKLAAVLLAHTAAPGAIHTEPVEVELGAVEAEPGVDAVRKAPVGLEPDTAAEQEETDNAAQEE
jgi:hypothetical protein